MKVEFCLPVYNEEKIIRDSIVKLYDFLMKQNFVFNWNIMILNNGSTDSTRQICTELKNQKISFENIIEAGRGRALKNYWIKSDADVLVYMDIDLAVSLENIPSLMKPLTDEGYDMAIGSRLLPESSIKRSFIRELSSQMYNFLSRVILHHNFSDMQCGFKAIKKEVIIKIAPFIKDNKWFFDTELVILAKYNGYRIKEVPVEWEENRFDVRKSKVNILRDSLRFIINLIILRLRLPRISR
jgi:glycosyltransferase involved in cell wall biosynthesis